MPDLKDFPFVWCDTCDSIQPMKIEVMNGKHKAADVICVTCFSIIATLHEAKT
jgi:hypothetical protein